MSKNENIYFANNENDFSNEFRAGADSTFQFHALKQQIQAVGSVSSPINAMANSSEIQSFIPKENQNYMNGIGAALMYKMGYKPGMGLGREKQGMVEPLKVPVLIGRGGIGALVTEDSENRVGEKKKLYKQKSDIEKMDTNNMKPDSVYQLETKEQQLAAVQYHKSARYLNTVRAQFPSPLTEKQLRRIKKHEEIVENFENKNQASHTAVDSNNGSTLPQPFFSFSSEQNSSLNNYSENDSSIENTDIESSPELMKYEKIGFGFKQDDDLNDDASPPTVSFMAPPPPPEQSSPVVKENSNYMNGIGAALMLKMGYKPGMGLGREKQGIVEPLKVPVLIGRGGIGALVTEDSENRGAEKSKMCIQKIEDIKLLGTKAQQRTTLEYHKSIAYLNTVKAQLPSTLTDKQIKKKKKHEEIVASFELNNPSVVVIRDGNPSGHTIADNIIGSASSQLSAYSTEKNNYSENELMGNEPKVEVIKYEHIGPQHKQETLDYNKYKTITRYLNTMRQQPTSTLTMKQLKRIKSHEEIVANFEKNYSWASEANLERDKYNKSINYINKSENQSFSTMTMKQMKKMQKHKEVVANYEKTNASASVPRNEPKFFIPFVSEEKSTTNNYSQIQPPIEQIGANYQYENLNYNQNRNFNRYPQTMQLPPTFTGNQMNVNYGHYNTPPAMVNHNNYPIWGGNTIATIPETTNQFLPKQNYHYENEFQNFFDPSNELQIAIIDDRNPDGSIQYEQWELIEERLSFAMFDAHADEILLRGDGWMNGVKLINCGNQRTMNFLMRTIGSFGELWPRAQLKVFPSSLLRTIISIWIDIAAPKEEFLLNYIQEQNPTLNMSNWQLISMIPCKGGNTILVKIAVDQKSIFDLKAVSSKLRFGSTWLKIYGLTNFQLYKENLSR